MSCPDRWQGYGSFLGCRSGMVTGRAAHAVRAARKVVSRYVIPRRPGPVGPGGAASVLPARDQLVIADGFRRRVLVVKRRLGGARLAQPVVRIALLVELGAKITLDTGPFQPFQHLLLLLAEAV